MSLSSDFHQHSYVLRRIKKLGIPAERLSLPPEHQGFTCKYFIQPSESGNIEIVYTDLEGKPLTFKNLNYQGRYSSAQPDYYIRTRLKNPPFNQKTGKVSAKYLSPKGSQNRPYLSGLLIGQIDLKSVETLVITEGEFKAISGCLNGIATVGVSGIHNLSQTWVMVDEVKHITNDNSATFDRLFEKWEGTGKVLEHNGTKYFLKRELLKQRKFKEGYQRKRLVDTKGLTLLLPELEKLIKKELPALKNVVFLHDADYLEGDDQRRATFFSSVNKFYEATKGTGKQCFYACIRPGHPKGLDDLIEEYGAEAAKTAIDHLESTDFIEVNKLDDHCIDAIATKFTLHLSLSTIVNHDYKESKYLKPDMLFSLVNKAIEDQSRIYIEAEPGRAKTTCFLGDGGILDQLRKQGKNAVFLSPYVGTAKKHANEFSAIYYRRDRKHKEGNHITNFDQLLSLLSKEHIDVVIIDEAHRFFDAYRKILHSLTSMLFEHKSIPVIGLSGTPGLERFFYDELHKFDLQPREKLKAKIYRVDNAKKAALNLVTQLEGKFMVRCNTFDLAKSIAQNTLGCAAICSPNNERYDESDHDVLDQVIATGDFNTKGIACTPYLDEGYTIEGINDLILLNCHDISAIIQFINRARSQGITVHLIYSGEEKDEVKKEPKWAIQLDKAYKAAKELAQQYNDSCLTNDTGRNPGYVGNAVRWNGENYSVSLPAVLSHVGTNDLEAYKGVSNRRVDFYRRNWSLFYKELTNTFNLTESDISSKFEIEKEEPVDEMIIRKEVIQQIGEKESKAPRLYRKWEKAQIKLREYALDDDLSKYESRRQINEEIAAAQLYYDRMKSLKGECSSAAEVHQCAHVQHVFETIQDARRLKKFSNGFKVSELKIYLQERGISANDTALGKFMKRAFEVVDVNKKKHLIQLVKARKFDYNQYRKAQKEVRGFGSNSITNESKTPHPEPPEECPF